jgi:hypothetical protein
LSFLIGAAWVVSLAMAGKLIMLPLRVWLGSARLLTRAGIGAAERAISLAGQTIGVASSNGSDHERGPRPDSRVAETGWREESIEEPVSPVEVEHPHDDAEARPTPRSAPPRTPTRPPSSPPVRPAPAEPEAPIVQEPVHVSEEPELVREEAEPGAEDGAGAQLRVAEPWNGYAKMNARDVIARAQASSPAELAAVRLYESRHRSRQTVLAAVDRQLKLSGGGNPA